MAMGFSSQKTPFKPCYPSSLWFSPSFRRSSSTWVPRPSSHALEGQFPIKDGFGVSGADYSCSRNYPTSYFQTFRRSQNQFPFRGKSSKLFNWEIEEKKRQGIGSCFHESLAGVSGSGNYSRNSVHVWLEESKIIKEQREQGRYKNGLQHDGTALRKDRTDSELQQDGSSYDKSERSHWERIHSGVGNTRRLPLMRSESHRETYKSNTCGELHLLKSGSKNTSVPYSVHGSQASQALSFVEQEVGGINLRPLAANSLSSVGIKENASSDLHSQTDLSTREAFRDCSQSIGSLGEKLLGENQLKLSDITEIRPDNAIERDTSDRESAANGHISETYVTEINSLEEHAAHLTSHHKKLACIYDKVLVVDNIKVARRVVKALTKQYKDLVHACDTEVAWIDVKDETPVDHGEIICFSIYSGPQADFDGKSCIWVDVLDGGRDLLLAFAPFFEDPNIKKVWHNYSFDSHILENYGFSVSGFHSDTMHLARLWDSSRRTDGGYSLEALTSDPKVMSGGKTKKEKVISGAQLRDDELIGKISMKSIFGKKKIKKDGSEGKMTTIAPVEELQRTERVPWICYSALDSMSTLKLFESLKEKLMGMPWRVDGYAQGTMYDFYEEYWRPFGELLVKMEAEGMLVDREYLSEIEKVAISEQQVAAQRFKKWASSYCPDAMYMNVGSDAQLRQLFFGGTANRKDPTVSLPEERTFKVPNIDKVIEEGKKVPTKYRTISLCKLDVKMQAEIFTATGWPSVSGDALKALAGKVPAAEHSLVGDANGFELGSNGEISSELAVDEVDERETPVSGADNFDASVYGTAYAAFGEGKDGRDACHAIAALCEVCSIDSLISNFILPLQGSHISGKNGRVHCSLNINTETGRLSARRPNLQNQPALEKDRYKIRQAFIAAAGNSLIVADYGQLELRILAHLANCKSMLDAFKAGGDFHSRTAMNMYPHIREAVEKKRVLLEWYPQPGEEKPPVPLLKDAFASERRKAKMLNFSIAYGKTPVGLSRDWKVSVKEAQETVNLWYRERREVLRWQEERKQEAEKEQCVYTLLGRARRFPNVARASNAHRGHIERAAINTPVQGSAADVAMCAMLEISRNARLKELGWRLLLQVHDEVILEGPAESAEVAKAIVVQCMSKPFNGANFLKVDLSVDAKCAQNWYAAK